jgi:hypothetical protein
MLILMAMTASPQPGAQKGDRTPRTQMIAFSQPQLQMGDGIPKPEGYRMKAIAFPPQNHPMRRSHCKPGDAIQSGRSQFLHKTIQSGDRTTKHESFLK